MASHLTSPRRCLHPLNRDGADKDDPSTSQASLACEVCRRKKVRCDRRLPSCLLCVKNRETCTYPKSRQKPGPKPIRRVEARGDATLSRNQRRKRSAQLPVGGHYQWARETIAQSPPFNARQNGIDQRDLPSGAFVDPSPTLPGNGVDLGANFIKAISLTSIIHPTHQHVLPPLPSLDHNSGSNFLKVVDMQSFLLEICLDFGLSLSTFQLLVDSYFDNMSTYSLFHRPSFGTKLQKVENLTHVKALFAAMFSFSARFQSVPINNDSLNSLQPRVFDHTRFRENALDLIQRSLGNPDEEPSLCLLQAMALSSFYELTKGVQGRAWRLLGSCVRVAYELHLHLVDYESRSTPIPDGSRSSSWSAAEEKRRCWWAIWDMDIFASTIRRCPTAIDSSMIDTQLPVSDEFWFNNEFHASCFLDTDPGERVRALVNCKNECAFAWLIVINSIMRNAQVLLRGNLQGILLDVCPLDNLDQLLHYFRSSFSKAKGEEATTKLIALEQALVEVSKAIPESLAYRQEALDFTNTENPRLTHREARKLHSAVFNILLSTQLARFMIYHSYAFGEIVSGTLFAGNQGTTSGCMPSAIAAPIIPANAQGWRNCLEAADNILAIVTRCPESHVKYVNPFLASTVWLAAALQIVRKVYGNNIDAELIQSKVDCLRATCEKYAAFWQTPRRMLENLDTLEHRLLQLGHGAMTAEGFSVGKGSVSMLSGLIRTDTATPVRHGPSFPDTSNHLSMPTLGEECSYQSQVGAISPAAEDGAYWNLSPAAGHIHNAAMQTDPTWLYDLMDLSPSKIFS